LPIIVSFYYIYISRGNVVMQLRYGEIFNNYFFASCSQSAPVRELRKSPNILRRYGQYKVSHFFRT